MFWSWKPSWKEKHEFRSAFLYEYRYCFLYFSGGDSTSLTKKQWKILRLIKALTNLKWVSFLLIFTLHIPNFRNRVILPKVWFSPFATGWGIFDKDWLYVLNKAWLDTAAGAAWTGFNCLQITFYTKVYIFLGWAGQGKIISNSSHIPFLRQGKHNKKDTLWCVSFKRLNMFFQSDYYWLKLLPVLP